MAELRAALQSLLEYGADGKPKNSDPAPGSEPRATEETPNTLASPDYTFIFSGPPLLRLAGSKAFALAPMGLLNGLNDTSQRPSMSVTEFGASYRQAFVGVPSHSVTLQRVVGLFSNLMGALYGWLPPDTAFNLAPNSPDAPNQKVSFTSDLTYIPFGLYICQLTAPLDFISATYYENCLLTGRGRSVTAGEAVILENVQLTYERDLPAPKLF